MTEETWEIIYTLIFMMLIVLLVLIFGKIFFMINKEKFKQFLNKQVNDEWFFSQVPLSLCDKPITVLCGVNGSGKTMSLRMFEQDFEKNSIKYLFLSSSY